MLSVIAQLMQLAVGNGMYQRLWGDTLCIGRLHMSLIMTQESSFELALMW